MMAVFALTMAGGPTAVLLVAIVAVPLYLIARGNRLDEQRFARRQSERRARDRRIRNYKAL